MKKIQSKPLKDPKKERFVKELVGGATLKDAYLAIHPEKKQTCKDETIRQKASRLAAKPQVKARKEELQNELIPDSVIKKNELLEMLSKELRGASAVEGGLTDATGLVREFAKMMGYYPDQQVVLKNGGVSENYRPPRAVQGLTDEELSGLLRASPSQ